MMRQVKLILIMLLLAQLLFGCSSEEHPLKSASTALDQAPRVSVQASTTSDQTAVEGAVQGTLWGEKDPLPEEYIDSVATLTASAASTASASSASGATEALEDLALLGKVWGMAKYYHPSARSGHVDMDRELLGLLPDYMAAESRSDREALLVAWLDALGPLRDQGATLAGLFGAKADVALEPDLEWTQKEVQSKELAAKLQRLQKIQLGIDSHYVTLSTVGGADFGNELTYNESISGHPSLRLLTLFRIWNAFQYYSPYRQLTDQPWSAVLQKHIAPFLAADTEASFDAATLSLLSETDDGHVCLIGGLGRGARLLGDYYVPLRVTYAEKRWWIGGPLLAESEVVASSKGLGISPGDELIAVNGLGCEALYEARQNWMASSTEANRRLNFARRMLLRSFEPNIELTLRRGDKQWTVTVEGESIGDYNYSLWDPCDAYPAIEALPNNGFYINPSKFTVDDLAQWRDQLVASRGILLDLRGYPSDGVLFELLPLLIESPIAGATFTTAALDKPGTFRWQEPTDFRPQKGSANGNSGTKPRVIALVDESSLSQPEYIAMYVKAMPRGLLVGRPTAGADGNVSLLPLPSGDKMAMTGLGTFYPDRSPTQRIGIVPDVLVPLQVSSIRLQRDEIYLKALSILLEKP